MSAAKATLAVMESEDVPARARAAGARLQAGLEKMPGVASVRGEGLLLAAVLTEEIAVPACRQALEAGLVINAPRPEVLRFAPSLLVTEAEIDEALGTLGPLLARLGPGGARAARDQVADQGAPPR
jgi:acetylornithine/succinyldiaminopimelate/putrescine aminotransferase